MEATSLSNRSQNIHSRRIGPSERRSAIVKRAPGALSATEVHPMQAGDGRGYAQADAGARLAAAVLGANEARPSALEGK
jgi:hypothetical protein